LFRTVSKVAAEAQLLETGRRPLEQMVQTAARLTGNSNA
jgi:hypothetical protein